MIQSEPYVCAGTDKKVIADNDVANKLKPTAQPGMLFDATKKFCEVAKCFFLKRVSSVK